MKDRKRKVIGICLFACLVCLLYVVVDYLNLPNKIGISVANLNIDLLSIIIGNIIVLTIAAATFVLIDARNIEKDNMAKFSAVLLLSEAYVKIETFIPIIESCIREADKNTTKEIFNNKQLEHITNAPFENDKIIYDNLSCGNLDYKFYKSYVEVKKAYEVVIFLLNLRNINLSENVFKAMKEQMNSERKSIEEYLHSFNKKLKGE